MEIVVLGAPLAYHSNHDLQQPPNAPRASNYNLNGSSLWRYHVLHNQSLQVVVQRLSGLTAGAIVLLGVLHRLQRTLVLRASCTDLELPEAY